MKKAIAIAALLSAIAFPLAAQTTMQAHHPDSAETQSAAAHGKMGGQMKSGMGMGEGMMGQGMMECPIMGQMKGEPRTEGRLAFLRAELKITSKQEGAWNDYAEVMRRNRQDMTDHMSEMRQSMMKKDDAAQTIDRPPAPMVLQNRIKMMETMLANLKTVEAATSKLYGKLDQAQKATADDLLGAPCSMMNN